VKPETLERLFGFQHALDHSATLGMTLIIAFVLAVAPLIIWLLARSGKIPPAEQKEQWRRYWSWVGIAPLLLAPILLGAFWTILGVGILSLLCYSEYARATGLFREKIISLVVTLGIVMVMFAVLDNWYRLFVAVPSFTIGVIASAAILRDEPKGYIQRVALGVFGFSLFGTCLAHLGYLANHDNYRPHLILVVLSVEINDVFAYVVGKTLGKRKLAPNTSPRKTVAGAVGAIVLTTPVVMLLGTWVFHGTPLGDPVPLIALGILISVIGQLGDLMLSSLKRDLRIEDMGVAIPGHGGMLDRFDSLILVAPVAFHYIHHFIGKDVESTQRILTGR
jgi:phosphatidate cytidylyltransferase